MHYNLPFVGLKHPIAGFRKACTPGPLVTNCVTQLQQYSRIIIVFDLINAGQFVFGRDLDLKTYLPSSVLLIVVYIPLRIVEL